MFNQVCHVSLISPSSFQLNLHDDFDALFQIPFEDIMRRRDEVLTATEALVDKLGLPFGSTAQTACKIPMISCIILQMSTCSCSCVAEAASREALRYPRADGWIV